MPNIFDVAALAGVSKTTVSKVINNQYGVSSATREKVLAAAKSLGYIPNQAAKSLVTSKSYVIGVVCNTSFKLSIYIELSSYLQKYAQSYGYNLVFCNYNEDADIKAKYINYFMGGAADGIIFFGSDKNDRAFIENIKARHYPLVVIENYFENLKINNILIDNVSGSKDVISYLASLGHKKIAYIAGNMEQRVSSDRFNGYMQGLQKNSLHFNSDYVVYSDFSPGIIKKSIHKFLSLREKPTAIYFFNDVMAYEALWELNNLKVKVPEDISLVGFDNLSSTFDFLRFPLKLTSVSQPVEEISKAAVKLLIENINNTNMCYKQLSFKTNLIKGNSCSDIICNL